MDSYIDIGLGCHEVHEWVGKRRVHVWLVVGGWVDEVGISLIQ